MSEAIRAEGERFAEWLANWYESLETRHFEEVFPDPERAAVLVVDLLIGFCRKGPLSSPRVNDLVGPSTDLLARAHSKGVRRFLVANDSHAADAPEFEAWPPHCVRGTGEAAIVPELTSLPFFDEFVTVEKNALSPGIDPKLHEWLEANDDVLDYLVIGDCTDLCVYQMAMFVRTWANATNRAERNVWVSASLVDTYDLPPGTDIAMPHPGDFMHATFLYHMALNGVRIVRSVR